MALHDPKGNYVTMVVMGEVKGGAEAAGEVVASIEKIVNERFKDGGTDTIITNAKDHEPPSPEVVAAVKALYGHGTIEERQELLSTVLADTFEEEFKREHPNYVEPTPEEVAARRAEDAKAWPAIRQSYLDDNRQKYFDVANDVANRPGLNPRETAHAVAAKLYTVVGHQFDYCEGAKDPVDLKQHYSQLFDLTHAVYIKAGLVRQASELFD